MGSIFPRKLKSWITFVFWKWIRLSRLIKSLSSHFDLLNLLNCVVKKFFNKIQFHGKMDYKCKFILLVYNYLLLQFFYIIDIIFYNKLFEIRFTARVHPQILIGCLNLKINYKNNEFLSIHIFDKFKN